jgi:hypothetical protein
VCAAVLLHVRIVGSGRVVQSLIESIRPHLALLKHTAQGRRIQPKVTRREQQGPFGIIPSADSAAELLGSADGGKGASATAPAQPHTHQREGKAGGRASGRGGGKGGGRKRH